MPDTSTAKAAETSEHVGGKPAGQRRDYRVEELRDERNEGNGWFVYLRPGFQLDGSHCFGEDRRSDVRATLSRVKACERAECRAALSKAKGEQS